MTRALPQYKGSLSQVWGFPCCDRLIVNMGIRIVVRQYLYMKTAPREPIFAIAYYYITVQCYTTNKPAFIESNVCHIVSNLRIAHCSETSTEYATCTHYPDNKVYGANLGHTWAERTRVGHMLAP